MKKVAFIFILAFTNSLISLAQNLVPNPSFELYNDCPYWVAGPGGYPQHIVYSPSYDSFPTVLYWVSPLSIGSAGYYNQCETTLNGHGVPLNTFGYQKSHSGVAYTSIYLYSRILGSWHDFRQYIEARLQEKMLFGHQYYISFYISLAASSLSKAYGTVITTDNVGAYVSDTMVSDSIAFGGDAYLTKPVTVRNPPGKFITDTAGWTKIEGTYNANGGEQWITLGHFNDGLPMNDTFMFSIRDSVLNNDSFVYCHVYIDDVCVMDITDSTGRIRDTSFCASSFPLILSSNVTAENYKWNTGETTKNISINKPGLYWRLATGECFYFIDTFRVQSKPIFYLGNDTAICKEIPLLLGTQQYDSKYLWSTGDTTCCMSALTSGLYSLTVTNYCGTTGHTIDITEISPCDNCLLVPNAFTPNSDGYNDIFLAQVRCSLPFYQMRIYNRYGQLVFESTNPAEGWDGTFKGSPQGIGVYCYYIEYSTQSNNNRKDIIKGNVTIMR